MTSVPKEAIPYVEAALSLGILCHWADKAGIPDEMECAFSFSLRKKANDPQPD